MGEVLGWLYIGILGLFGLAGLGIAVHGVYQHLWGHEEGVDPLYKQKKR